MNAKEVIGIDLGTCYTSAGLFNRGQFQIIEHASERKLLNYVAFKQTSREIGEHLKTKIRMHYDKVIFDTKIFLGSYGKDSPRFPFKVCPDDKKVKLEINAETRKYPEEITAIVLQKVKENAEKSLGHEVSQAVISVPASFTDSQRQAVKDSAKIAGLDVLRLINDTTAAAIAYAHDKYTEGKKCVFVFDLGGYYLNLGIISIENGVVEVKATKSHPEMGGQLMDYSMVQYLAREKQASWNIKTVQSMLVECEKAKKTLSNGSEAFIELPDEDDDDSFKFTRQIFEEINANLFEAAIRNVKNLIESVGLNKTQIDEVILVGGSSSTLMEKC